MNSHFFFLFCLSTLNLLMLSCKFEISILRGAERGERKSDNYLLTFQSYLNQCVVIIIKYVLGERLSSLSSVRKREHGMGLNERNTYKRDQIYSQTRLEIQS